ncbi:MAG: hypothetical protein QXU98_01960 [Candidatus Parvarchaeota archaeon]
MLKSSADIEQSFDAMKDELEEDIPAGRRICNALFIYRVCLPIPALQNALTDKVE